MSDLAEVERHLAAIARIMRHYRLDSVETPGGLKVTKSAPRLPREPAAPAQTPRPADGIVNALDEDDRIPLSDDEIQFAASRMPPMTLGDFAPQAPIRKEPSDGEE